MSLSRVHRAQEFTQLQEVHFTSFDMGGPAKNGVTAAEAFTGDAPRQEDRYGKGRIEGLQEAEQQFGSATEAMARALEELSRLREAILRNSSTDMLRLVLSISRQVIHREASIDPELIMKTIDKALQAAIDADRYTITINPDDLAIVEERKPLFMASVQNIDSIQFKTDPAVSRGGCLVESQLGQVDATIDGQLEEIENTLLGSLEVD